MSPLSQQCPSAVHRLKSLTPEFPSSLRLGWTPGLPGPQPGSAFGQGNTLRLESQTGLGGKDLKSPPSHPALAGTPPPVPSVQPGLGNSRDPEQPQLLGVCKKFGMGKTFQTVFEFSDFSNLMALKNWNNRCGTSGSEGTSLEWLFLLFCAGL